MTERKGQGLANRIIRRYKLESAYGSPFENVLWNLSDKEFDEIMDNVNKDNGKYRSSEKYSDV